MEIEILGAEDIVSKRGRGGKKSTTKYADYAAAIKPHRQWLIEQIEGAEDGTIRVKLADFAKACGKVMKKVVDGKTVDGSPGLDPTSLGWGFKYVLYHAGFFFTMGTTEDRQPVLILRKKIESDVLPTSLAKWDEEHGATKAAAEVTGEGAGTGDEGAGDGNGDEGAETGSGK